MERLKRALDNAIWELGEAFTDMPDADLWTRPHPKLLSVGELGGHLAYGLNEWFALGKIESPLNEPELRYYPYSIEQPTQVALTASELYAEIKRVHELCKAAFAERNPAPEEQHPARSEFTWGSALEYQVFHVAYHTGQIYSVRHLLGHETVDN